MGANNMTQEEQKHMDDKFESLKCLFTEMINNLKKTIDNYIKSLETKSKEQQSQISLIHAKTNENEIELIKLEGRVNTLEKVEEVKNEMIKSTMNGKVEKIEAVKKAEEDTKGKSRMSWQFWLVLVMSFIFSLTSTVLTIYEIINP